MTRIRVIDKKFLEKGTKSEKTDKAELVEISKKNFWFSTKRCAVGP